MFVLETSPPLSLLFLNFLSSQVSLNPPSVIVRRYKKLSLTKIKNSFVHWYSNQYLESSWMVN